MIFKEYLNEDKLFNYIPWGYLINLDVEEDEKNNQLGLMLNKDGTLQVTIKYRGQDLDSSLDDTVDLISYKINELMKRLGNEYSFYIEARRKKSKIYESHIDKINKIPLYLMESKRKENFESGNHYESEYYFTIVYSPPKDNSQKISDLYITKSKDDVKEIIAKKYLDDFVSKISFFFAEFSTYFVEAKLLNQQELLTYLHSTISRQNINMTVPTLETPIDSYLYDTELIGGLEPRLEDEYLKVISINSFPDTSYSCILDSLNRLPINYRWVTRFIPIEKEEALKTLNSQYKKWFGGRKSFFQLIQETFTGRETEHNINRDSLSKAEEVQEEKELIQGEYASLGYYTNVLILQNKDVQLLEEDSNLIQKVINSIGFTCVEESLNSVEGYLGSLPGNFTYNVRKPLINSIFLSHLLPLSCVWQGEQRNKYLKDTSLIATSTSGSTPFYLNLHQGDVGHTMIIGPTGSGKSVLLNAITNNWFKYEKSKVFTFDKGGSSKVLTKALDGIFYDLGHEDNIISFQPLKNIDKDIEFCQEWLENIFIQEKIELIPEKKEHIYKALLDLKGTPVELRTISSFATYLQDEELRLAIKPYTNQGIMGKYFDSNNENIDLNNFYTVFEMEKISDNKTAITPILSYLFYRLEQSLDGNPTLIILDECWLFFDNEQFEQKIREWLKVLRKKNASVVFATQELSDIINSNISNTIKNSCKTKILLPDPLAQQNIDLYKSFGLNDEEVKILSQATQKKEYYYKSEKGNRLFELDLSQVELSYLATSSEADNKKYQTLENLGNKNFNIEWLRYKGIEKPNEIVEKVIKRISELPK